MIQDHFRNFLCCGIGIRYYICFRIQISFKGIHYPILQYIVRQEPIFIYKSLQIFTVAPEGNKIISRDIDLGAYGFCSLRNRRTFDYSYLIFGQIIEISRIYGCQYLF